MIIHTKAKRKSKVVEQSKEEKQPIKVVKRYEPIEEVAETAKELEIEEVAETVYEEETI